MALSEETIQAVWEKARVRPNRNSTVWRQDQCGAWLHREQYDNTESDYGWRILSISPGGGNDPDDLQPFHWNNDFDIALARPRCRITADRTGLTPAQEVDPPRNTAA